MVFLLNIQNMPWRITVTTTVPEHINGAILFKTIFSVDNNRKISKKVASDIIDRLNEYQRDKSTIPEEVLGYIEEWRNQ